MLSLIAAIGRNRELGKNGQLLWHIPGDLPRFKQITMGHPIIMGRKTFLSFGRALPGRTNIVVTRSLDFSAPGVVVAHSLPEARAIAEAASGAEEIFVIGGAEIYRETLPQADRLYLTLIDREAEADVFFPEYREFDKVIAQEQLHVEGAALTYLTLEKSH